MILPELLANNRAWAERQTRRDPAFFDRLCAIQAPDYLWIGCADSRVPANEIVGLSPGDGAGPSWPAMFEPQQTTIPELSAAHV